MADLTSAGYYLHQPKPLRQFQGSMTPADRVTLAEQLLAQGFQIDPLIMVYGWDAALVMSWRQRNGIAWDLPYGHPLAGQLAFGPNNQGLAIYDPANPPRGAIITSTKAEDYPPIDPPVPVIPISTSVVAAWSGVLLGGKKQYFVNPLDTSPDGTTVTGPEGPLVKVARDTPWGTYQRWNPAS